MSCKKGFKIQNSPTFPPSKFRAPQLGAARNRNVWAKD